MSKKPQYEGGRDVPDDELLRDSKGRLLDDAYVEAAVEEAVKGARRGRPSLSSSGESPLLRVRVSPELNEAVTQAAHRAGRSRADWIRQTLDEATGRAS